MQNKNFMYALVQLAATVVQLTLLIIAAARYGLGAGLIVFGAILANAVQAAAVQGQKAKAPEDQDENK